MADFDQAWRKKLRNSLASNIDRATLSLVFPEKDAALLAVENDPVEWTQKVITRLEELKHLDKTFDSGKIHDIITACACQYPREPLQPIRDYYQSTKNLAGTHRMVQDLFRKDIKPTKNLTDKEIDKILSKGWGLAGTLHSDRIIATKIPKEYHQYFKETDEWMKRYRYCHCPRVRESLRKGIPELNSTYCLCGAGFYRGLWEYLLNSPVRVKVLKSVLKGDNVCQIEIKIK
ncbi:MAG: hypothetical protein DRO88_11585 [Promethearchaeia archaeon]|nr:MAG: hypothetical protein DRO88_11585 [Candidatus Lokiarchaeia archaeon]